jgi:hypothetical protein
MKRCLSIESLKKPVMLAGSSQGTSDNLVTSPSLNTYRGQIYFGQAVDDSIG